MRFVLAACLVAMTSAAASADVVAGADVHVDVTVGLPAPAPAPVPAPPPGPPPPPPAPVAVPAAPPPTAIVAAPAGHPMQPTDRWHPATLGLSLLASAGTVLATGERAEGAGFAFRIHPLDRYPLDVAIETEHDQYDNEMRSDWRIGYSLVYRIDLPGVVNPYVVFPMGVNIVSLPDHNAVVQGYVGIGAGLALRVGRHWMATVDARALSRNEQVEDGDEPVLGPETVAELRATTVFYF
jgi:hypothetical protein